MQVAQAEEKALLKKQQELQRREDRREAERGVSQAQSLLDRCLNNKKDNGDSAFLQS